MKEFTSNRSLEALKHNSSKNTHPFAPVGIGFSVNNHNSFVPHLSLSIFLSV
jgi:hypothetical protein